MMSSDMSGTRWLIATRQGEPMAVHQYLPWDGSVRRTRLKTSIGSEAIISLMCSYWEYSQFTSYYNVPRISIHPLRAHYLLEGNVNVLIYLGSYNKYFFNNFILFYCSALRLEFQHTNF